jgi:ubiquinone/menaquinone biosynthesis C-methylase UbiE
MEPSEYAKLAAFEETYWWHVGRRSIVARQLRKLNQHGLSILNVGGGTGGTVNILTSYGTVLNIDQSEEAVDRLLKSGYQAMQMDGRRTSFRNEQFDLITGLDVLEHIEEDRLALQEWCRILKPGGHLMLTVPAYQWLWSGHDVSLGHCRRYTAKELKTRVHAAGFQICNCTYAITFSFPLIAAFRGYQKLFRPTVQESSYIELPRILNSFFINLLRAEGILLEKCNFPFGTSVLLIGQKPVAKKTPLYLHTPQETAVASPDLERVSATWR